MQADLYHTHHTLIAKLKDPSNHAAWEEFYSFYWHLIIRWAIRCGCSETAAQDVFQESVLCLMRNLPGFNLDPEKGKFRSYLKTIVTRRAHDAIRRESKFVALNLELKDDYQDSLTKRESIDFSTPEESEIDLIWAKSLMEQALGRVYLKVDPMTYKSFRLYALDNLPMEEVLKKLPDLNENAVYKHKSRVLDILEKEFCKLLDEMDSAETRKLKARKEWFKGIFNEMIKEAPQFRDTIFCQAPMERAFLHLRRVLTQLNNIPNLPETGTLLVPYKNKALDSSKDAGENGNQSHKKWYEIGDHCVVGRHPSCNIPLFSKSASGLHASISLTDAGYLCQDQNSTNGTFVNQEKQPNPVFLKNGDLIYFSPREGFIFLNRI